MSKTGGQHRMVSQDAEFALRLVLFALIGGNPWKQQVVGTSTMAGDTPSQDL